MQGIRVANQRVVTSRTTLALFVLFISILPFNQICLAENRVYKVATVSWIGWSPLHVAQEKGFWAEQKISVQVVNYDDPIIILEAIKAGRIDFAMDMIGSLVGVYMEGTPIVALAETNWSHGGDKIIVKKGTTIHEHKGKPVGVFLNLPSCLYFLNRYLKTQSLTVSDFRVVEFHPDDMTQQFIAGRLPVIVNYEPWAMQAMRKGNGIALADSSQYKGCIPEGIWGYRSNIESIPESDIKKILTGWIRAAGWVNDPANWGEYKKILNEKTFAGHTPYSDSELKRMFTAVKIHQPETMLQRNSNTGGLNRYLMELKVFLKQSGRLQKEYFVTDIFDNRLVVDVLTDKKIHFD